MKITAINDAGIELICSFEGFEPKPYLCPAKVPTIGFGTTRYPNGQKVKIGDPEITRSQATLYLLHDVKQFELSVDALAVDTVTQNQFNALVSFAYNLGAGNLKSSTLLKKVNTNPNDKAIADEFMKWIRADGKKLSGLIRRRSAEATMYFQK